MSRKAKYSVEEKIKAAERYLRGEASAGEIAAEMKMSRHGVDMVAEWAAMYRENGTEGFHLTRGNSSYSSELKQQAVKDYLQGNGSLRGICRKYRISDTKVLRSWITIYNSNRELRDYDPKPEVYVAMARKTTKEERQEIVQYCLDRERITKEQRQNTMCHTRRYTSGCRNTWNPEKQVFQTGAGSERATRN